jgi:CRISPR-associated protein Cas2
MRGYGDQLQLSVFRCELFDRERAEMIAELSALIAHDQDQVLIIDIGPADGRGALVFESLGKPYVAPERHAIVV